MEYTFLSKKKNMKELYMIWFQQYIIMEETNYTNRKTSNDQEVIENKGWIGKAPSIFRIMKTICIELW